jgi:hypothetical protein
VGKARGFIGVLKRAIIHTFPLLIKIFSPTCINTSFSQIGLWNIRLDSCSVFGMIVTMNG